MFWVNTFPVSNSVQLYWPAVYLQGWELSEGLEEAGAVPALAIPTLVLPTMVALQLSQACWHPPLPGLPQLPYSFNHVSGSTSSGGQKPGSQRTMSAILPFLSQVESQESWAVLCLTRAQPTVMQTLCQVTLAWSTSWLAKPHLNFFCTLPFFLLFHRSGNIIQKL